MGLADRYESSTSAGPMSDAGPGGLVTPRWSRGGTWIALPASIAGFPTTSRLVSVEPPLSYKGRAKD
jgi:hypothetical protein